MPTVAEALLGKEPLGGPQYQSSGPQWLRMLGDAAQRLSGKIAPSNFVSASDAASMLPGGGLVSAVEPYGQGLQKTHQAVQAFKAGQYGDAAKLYGSGMLDTANAGLQAIPEVGPAMGAMSKLAMFLGPSAKTANLSALAKAETLSGSGAGARKIWDETGWFRGADGKWRFEIPDNASTFKNAEVSAAPDVGEMAVQVGMRDAFEHPDLYKAYPQIGNRRLVLTESNDGAHLAGGETHVGLRQMEAPDVQEYGTSVLSGMSEDGLGGGIRSQLLHELQHAIQEKEKFSFIGRPENMPFDVYRRLASEVEARNVQNRLNMTPQQRRTMAPWETEDVPRDQQILRFP